MKKDRNLCHPPAPDTLGPKTCAQVTLPIHQRYPLGSGHARDLLLVSAQVHTLARPTFVWTVLSLASSRMLLSLRAEPQSRLHGTRLPPALGSPKLWVSCSLPLLISHPLGRVGCLCRPGASSPAPVRQPNKEEEQIQE